MICTMSDCFVCSRKDCTNNYVKPIKAQSAEQKEKARLRREALVSKRISEGICINCGVRAPREGYKMCSQCQSKYRRYKERQNRERGITPRTLMDGVDLCAKCGKHKPAPGYKLCKRCLDNAISFLGKTPTHIKKQVHP